MVLAKLSANIAIRLEQLSQRRAFLHQPFFRAWQPDLREPGPDGGLPGDERSPAGGATLLALPVSEQRTFLVGNPA
jgi:hypothetical protein